MFILIKDVSGFCAYRDGGTLTVSYRGFRNSYRIEFPALLERDESDIRKVGYKKPILLKFKSKTMKSRVTGNKYQKTEESSEEINWDQAFKILHKMKPKLSNGKVEGFELYERMLNISKNSGSLKNS